MRSRARTALCAAAALALLLLAWPAPRPLPHGGDAADAPRLGAAIREGGEGGEGEEGVGEGAAAANAPSSAFYYDVFANVDVDGADLGSILSLDLALLKRACDALAECRGFNSNGWLKSSVSSRVPSAARLYVKLPVRAGGGAGGLLGEGGESAAELTAMARGLRIFAYPPPPALDIAGPADYKYGVEARFERLLRDSAFATTAPDEATFFFVPVRCAAHRYSAASRADGQAAAERAASAFVQHIQAAYPFWNRSLGVDHFYVCAHDMGASCAASADPLFRKNAIALVNTADYDDPFFAPHKDIALPPHPGDGCPTCTQGASHPLQPGDQPRDLLAFFCGTMARGRVRPRVLDRWRYSSTILIVDGALPVADYHAHLHRARFCLFLRGHRGWSPRLMDAVWAGCVPVIVADHYHLPLHGLVDWRAFSVSVAERDVDRLAEILESYSDAEYALLRSSLLRVRERFIWNDPPQPTDAFYSVLTLLWRRRFTLRLAEH